MPLRASLIHLYRCGPYSWAERLVAGTRDRRAVHAWSRHGRSIQRPWPGCAGLTDHAWTMHELLSYPVYRLPDAPPRSRARTYKDVLARLEGALTPVASG